MKENNIKFTLKNKEDKLVEITAELTEDNKLIRMGKPIMCSCTSNTVDGPTPFIYKGGVVECPVCHRRSESVVTFDDYESEEISNIHLRYFGTDYLTMQDLYKLSYTLPYEKWLLIEDLFMKLSPDDVDLGDFQPYMVGCVTSNPELVESRLDVKPELRVDYVKEQRIKEYKKDQQKHREQELLLSSILEEFSLVDTPESADGMFTVDGEVVDNPLNPWNRYGGGERFVITREYVWYIRNNSRDTDNHDFNNIRIKGSYGAIGKRIPYDVDLVSRVKKLK